MLSHITSPDINLTKYLLSLFNGWSSDEFVISCDIVMLSDLLLWSDDMMLGNIWIVLKDGIDR